MRRKDFQNVQANEASFMRKLIKEKPSIGKAIVTELFKQFDGHKLPIQPDSYRHSHAVSSYHRWLFRNKRSEDNLTSLIREQIFQYNDPWEELLNSTESQREEQLK
jgi:hypothetical protein